MRKLNSFFLLCLIGTLLLASGIILLPRYFSRSMDMRNMNKVAAVNRDDFSFLETSSGSVTDTVHALGKLKRDGSNLKLITSFNNAARINDGLLDDVFDQAINALEFGYLPWIGNRSWNNYIRSAKYYSLTYDSNTHPNTKEILSLWFLRFTDGQSFDYYFLVDAVNYRIYYAEIYNAYTDQAVLFAGSDYAEKKKFYSVDEDLFASGSAFYYGAQDYRYVSSSNLTGKLALVVLNFDQDTVYLEQLIMPENNFPYRGISVGFQGLGEKIQNLMKE